MHLMNIMEKNKTLNILFVTTFEISEQKGGTERTTARVSDALRVRGYKCYNLYDKVIENSLVRTKFDGVFCNVTSEHVRDIVDEYKIDKILYEGCFALISEVSRGVRMSACRPEQIFVHHFAPGFEPYFNAFYSLRKSFVNAINLNYKVKSLIKILLYPVYKPYMDYKFPKYYREAYSLCDKIVLLSSNYIDDYRKYAGITDKSKFRSINNALSFDTFISTSDLCKKQKKVLVVSRFDEVQKRISLVLKIWRLVEDDPSLKDWSLDLVGYGDSESDYRQLVSDLGLRRVSFEGRQDPQTYYAKSSIFIMTSLYEGWPMTINEALQYGCVPVAYDSVAAMSDILDNGVNGFLINDGAINDFYSCLKSLMVDDALLKQIQSNALDRSKDFSIDIIIEKWINLFFEK